MSIWSGARGLYVEVDWWSSISPGTQTEPEPFRSEQNRAPHSTTEGAMSKAAQPQMLTTHRGSNLRVLGGAGLYVPDGNADVVVVIVALAVAVAVAVLAGGVRCSLVTDGRVPDVDLAGQHTSRCVHAAYLRHHPVPCGVWSFVFG